MRGVCTLWLIWSPSKSCSYQGARHRERCGTKMKERSRGSIGDFYVMTRSSGTADRPTKPTTYPPNLLDPLKHLTTVKPRLPYIRGCIARSVSTTTVGLTTQHLHQRSVQLHSPNIARNVSAPLHTPSAYTAIPIPLSPFLRSTSSTTSGHCPIIARWSDFAWYEHERRRGRRKRWIERRSQETAQSAFGVVPRDRAW
jgi:hypothetical protein